MMFRLQVLLVAVLGLTSLACGAPATQRPAQEGGDEPRYGDVLRVAWPIDPYDWDLSYVGKGTGNGAGMTLAYNGLLAFKTGPDVQYGEGVIIPNLAERWEVSTDARTFTFHLRRGVKFANLPPVSGRELTSADVKWSYEYWSRSGWAKAKELPQGQYEWIFEGMQAVETPDPFTAVVRFAEPRAPFLSYAAADHNPIVPHEIYDQEGHLKNTIVGTGPFQLATEASQKGTRWVWKKNPTYFDQGKPYLDAAHWLVLPEGAPAFAAFQTKQVDILGDVGNIKTAREVERAAPGAIKYELEAPFPRDIFLRLDRPPLNDVRVRKAIDLALDPDEAARVFQEGRGGWTTPGILAGFFTQDEIRQMHPVDPERAKRLLAEAGHAGGLDLEMTYPSSAKADIVAENELFQAQLKKVGINLMLKPIDAAAYSTLRKQGQFTINVLSGADARWDADFPLTKFHANAKSNYYGVKDGELTRLVEAQRAEADPVKRREIIRQAGRHIAEQAYGVAWYSLAEYYFWHPALKNFAPNWNRGAENLADVWLAR